MKTIMVFIAGCNLEMTQQLWGTSFGMRMNGLKLLIRGWALFTKMVTRILYLG